MDVEAFIFRWKKGINSVAYSWYKPAVGGLLPLQFGLKCEGVPGVLAHVQNALGHSDRAVVRLVQFVNYEEQVWAQSGHDKLAPDESRQVHQHCHGQKRVGEHLDGRWEKRVDSSRWVKSTWTSQPQEVWILWKRFEQQSVYSASQLMWCTDIF